MIYIFKFVENYIFMKNESRSKLIERKKKNNLSRKAFYILINYNNLLILFIIYYYFLLHCLNNHRFGSQINNIRNNKKLIIL